MAIFILTGGSVVIERIVDKIFLVIGDEKCCGLILLSCLSFAAIAFFSEGKVEVVAVEADPISLSGLVCASGHSC